MVASTPPTSPQPPTRYAMRPQARFASSSATTISQAPPGAHRGSFPLKHRDATLRSLAAAGAELVLGGHIHQSSAAERHAFESLGDDARGSLVLATAPGFGRPRPHRLGEANGLHVVRWTTAEIEVETRIWRNGAFVPTGAYRAPRG